MSSFGSKIVRRRPSNLDLDTLASTSSSNSQQQDAAGPSSSAIPAQQLKQQQQNVHTTHPSLGGGKMDGSASMMAGGNVAGLSKLFLDELPGERGGNNTATSSPRPATAPRGNAGVPGGSFALMAAAQGGMPIASEAPGNVAGNMLSVAPLAPSNRDGMRDLFSKRIQSFQYVKGALSGKQLWMNTIRIYRRDLDAAFDSERLKKRTMRNMILGLSLAPLLEIKAAGDFCRATQSILNELDNFVEALEKDKGKVRGMFRGKGKGRADLAASDTAITPVGISADTTLLYPNIPYTLDFAQVYMTLCDMIVEVYHKLTLYLGPPTSSGRPRSSTGPSISAGGSSPNPALGSHPPAPPSFSTAGHFNGGGGHLDSAFEPDLALPPKQLTPALVEAMIKLDSKLRKILVQVSKEMDALARHLIREELSNLESVVKGASLTTMSGTSPPPPPATASHASLSSTIRTHYSTSSISNSSSGKMTGSSFGFNPASVSSVSSANSSDTPSVGYSYAPRPMLRTGSTADYASFV